MTKKSQTRKDLKNFRNLATKNYKNKRLKRHLTTQGLLNSRISPTKDLMNRKIPTTKNFINKKL